MKKWGAIALVLASAIVVGGGLLACADVSGTRSLPSGISDPNTFKTPDGAMAMYHNAVYAFEYGQQAGSAGQSGFAGAANGAFVNAVITTGIMTDELQADNLGGSASSYAFGTVTGIDSLDARQIGDDGFVIFYDMLHGVRGAASQGIGALAAYAPDAPPALRGHLHALAGYAELLLADVYCSGVPLSTLDFNGDYTYQPGSTTAQVYAHAVAQFDTALTLASDSARILNLARVGRGRALLALGRYSDAATAVADVPDAFAYQFPVDWSGGLSNNQSLWSTFLGGVAAGVTVVDREGGNGLPYMSSDDPRSAVQPRALSPNQYGRPLYAPQKYGGTTLGVVPITVADGIEARLIESEAAFQARDMTGWLAKLNRARALAASTLPPLEDPGTDSARIALMFSERAYDLFLTGHRQGDMRRMIRQYHLDQRVVYPVGGYPSILPVYGTAVTLPVPIDERVNPLFTGCLDRSA